MKKNSYLCKIKNQITPCGECIKRYFFVPMKYKAKDLSIHTLENANGMRVVITNFGARILQLWVPDKDGNLQDVVLGFDNLEDYFPENHQTDFGALIGRYANRICDGRFPLNGTTIQLPRNNGKNCLHGGPDGWQYRVFEVEKSEKTSLLLSLVSPDGDNQFPGEVKALVEYILTEDNALEIHYSASSDSATVINLTNHSYFNLNGDASTSILNHNLQISAEDYLPIDETSIPLGMKSSVKNTPMDFRIPKAVGKEISEPFPQLLTGRGYDHCWILSTPKDLTQRCALLESPSTGIKMEVYSSEPGLQIYTSNFLDGSLKGKKGIFYQERSAICLETQKYPDSPNHNWEESNPWLVPGEEYNSCTIFKFKR